MGLSIVGGTIRVLWCIINELQHKAKNGLF